ncbi:MAG UNVERIFIED_CONTAM: hypothetical protein LVT10_14145 [Anaerolineae bacterium]
MAYNGGIKFLLQDSIHFSGVALMEHSTIALQLYTVRDYLKVNFEQTIRTLDGWGIRVAETAGEFGGNVRTAKALFDSLGWAIPSTHAPLPFGRQAT